MKELTEREFQTLMDAVIEQESDYNPEALSLKGAEGLCQLMPSTGRELWAEMLSGRDYKPFDPDINRMLASRYMRKLLVRYNHNPSLALAAYNWGMGNVGRAINDLREQSPTVFLPDADIYPSMLNLVPRGVENYVARITKRYKKRFQLLFPGLQLSQDEERTNAVLGLDPAN